MQLACLVILSFYKIFSRKKISTDFDSLLFYISLQDLIKNSTARSIIDCQDIYQGKDELVSSDEPFGLAYDIDNFPKISMVHTLDRVPDQFNSRGTFIEICSERAVCSCASIPSEGSHRIHHDQLASKGNSAPVLDTISDSKRGILYEATRNAKRLARNYPEMQRMDKPDYLCGIQTIDDDMRGAKKRKKNQRQRHMYDLKTEPIKYDKPGRHECRRTISLLNDNRCRCNWNLNSKRHCAEVRNRLIETKELPSLDNFEYADIERCYSHQVFGSNHRMRCLSTEYRDLHSINSNRPQRHPTDTVVKLEHNSDLQSDSDLSNDYSLHSFSL